MSREELLKEKMDIVMCRVREDWHYDRIKEINADLAKCTTTKVKAKPKPKPPSQSDFPKNGWYELIRIDEEGNETIFIKGSEFKKHGYNKKKISDLTKDSKEGIKMHGYTWKRGRQYQVRYVLDGKEYKAKELNLLPEGNSTIRTKADNNKDGWSMKKEWV